jgi:ABC-type dipeptide/oligopeptide/nickel transport system ATPase component
VLPGSARYSGSVRCGDQDVLALGPSALRSFRWQRVSLVMQGATNALNPVMTIDAQIIDMIRAHSKVSKRAAAAQVPRSSDPCRRSWLRIGWLSELAARPEPRLSGVMGPDGRLAASSPPAGQNSRLTHDIAARRRVRNTNRVTLSLWKL